MTPSRERLLEPFRGGACSAWTLSLEGTCEPLELATGDLGSAHSYRFRIARLTLTCIDSGRWPIQSMHWLREKKAS